MKYIDSDIGAGGCGLSKGRRRERGSRKLNIPQTKCFVATADNNSRRVVGAGKTLSFMGSMNENCERSSMETRRYLPGRFVETKS
jgi:hypothetical protein